MREKIGCLPVTQLDMEIIARYMNNPLCLSVIFKETVAKPKKIPYGNCVVFQDDAFRLIREEPI
jgi:hypothetical protein